MADSFCTLWDFPSLTTNYNLHLFLPPKHYYPSAFVRFHNSRINRIKRRPFRLTLLSQPSSPKPSFSSSDLDVISTHEHSDGSLLFRFGDPSEVAKNVKMEESKNMKEETERARKTANVKVLHGDREKEVSVEKGDTEITNSGLTEVTDHTNSIVISSESISVVEGEIDTRKKLLESSNDVKLPALVSSKEMEVTSTPGVDIEQTGSVEEDLKEYDDSRPANALLDKSSIENNITTVELLEKGTADTSIADVDMEQTGSVEEDLNEEYEDSNPVNVSILDKSTEMENNITTEEVLKKGTAETSIADVDIEHTESVEEDLNEEYGDSSPANASILDKSSAMENNITTVELLEKGTADTSIPSVEVEHNKNVEEGLNEEHEDSSPSDASILEKSSEMENNITTEELLETDEAAGVIILDSLMPDPIITVPVHDLFQACVDTVITDVSAVSENQNVEREIQNEIIEDGRFESDLVSPLPESEPALSVSEEIEEQNIQAGMQNLIIGKGSETAMNGIATLEVQIMSNLNNTEAEPLPMEAYINSSEGSQASGAGTEMSNEIVEYGGESDMIQLMTVSPDSPQLEAESAFDEETGVDTVEESREDDGAESLTSEFILASERNEVDDNGQTGDLVEASIHEVTELKSTGSTDSQEILSIDFVLSSGAALLPHPSKVLTGGEDAYFVASQTWLGVADGVGQWSFQGTKPGVYAQELIKNCAKLISNCNGDSINNPVELLDLSVAETDSNGSSTVLIAQFDGQALHVANVGDSGFIVLRHGAVYKRSSPMYHVFHFPKRIERGDDPSSLAELYKIDLEEEDVIITATDGLLDNLYDQEISLIVKKLLAADKKLEEIAEFLAREAHERGGSASARSPFSDDAQAAGFSGYTGSKLDDIAVIVSMVQRQPNSETL